MSEQVTVLAVYRMLYRAYGPQHWWPAKTPFEMMVGAILTQNTAWSNVEKAILALKQERLLNEKAMRLAKPRLLKRCIRSAGYFNVKTTRLKNLVKYLDSQKPSQQRTMSTSMLRHKLLSVNGVGPETADSILLYAFKRPVFVIDAYTKRIFSRLGFFEPQIAYDDAQRFFASRLKPSERQFNEYHALIVRHAKEYCRTRPLCDDCPLTHVCAYSAKP